MQPSSNHHAAIKQPAWSPQVAIIWPSCDHQSINQPLNEWHQAPSCAIMCHHWSNDNHRTTVTWALPMIRKTPYKGIFPPNMTENPPHPQKAIKNSINEGMGKIVANTLRKTSHSRSYRKANCTWHLHLKYVPCTRLLQRTHTVHATDCSNSNQPPHSVYRHCAAG